MQAFGVLLTAREAGKRVPEDLSVVGYDDVKVSRYIGLTSIDQKMRPVGEHATVLLVERVLGQRTAAPETFAVVPELRIRTTTGPVPAA